MGDVDGQKDKVIGKAKEVVGDLTDDNDLRREGKLQHAGGTVKEKIADVEHTLEDGVDRAREAIARHQD